MKYLFDTNILSDLYDQQSKHRSRITKAFQQIIDDEIYVSVLSLFELEYGYANAPEDKKKIQRNVIDSIKNIFSILPITEEHATNFGEIKKAIKDLRGISNENIKKHNLDFILASVAITEGCILVSSDQIYKDISRFQSDFKYENWISVNN